MVKVTDTVNVLKSSDGRAEMHYYVEGGGYLHHLALSKDGKQLKVMATYGESDQIISNPRYHSTVLFPFPNRLKDGKYRFEGKEYRFPVNEKPRGTALHGFLREATPEIDIQDNAIKTRYKYNGSREYYPFPADVIVDYDLVGSSELEVTFSVINTGKTSMPFGIGWHPYFLLGNSEDVIDELMFQMPPNNQVIADDRMIPTGETSRYSKFNELQKLSDSVLSGCFVPLKGGAEAVSVILWSEKEQAGIEVWQDDQFGFIQLYTPPDRRSIAIEPMSCNVNAFQNHDGLVLLAAGETFRGKCGVRMITKQ